MKAVIFAGGSGTRLWPLSRKKSPKQFEKIVGDKSTLQLSVQRLYPEFKPTDIYIATTHQYVPIITKQLPDIPPENIIGEPEARDVGPAVGLMTALLVKTIPNEPFILLWSDHLVKETQLFAKIIQSARKVVQEEKNKIVFIGQKPRFASVNLGWIEFGKQLKTSGDVTLHEFKKFKYRPELPVAEEFLKDGHHAWNLGYFVTTPQFLWKQYQKFVPTIFEKLEIIQKDWHTPHFQKTLTEVYPTIEKIHFDTAILEQLNTECAYVISENIGWSDVGAWEALKEALQSDPEQNVIKGKVLTDDTRDSLVYNYTDQTVVAIDLDGYVVINTSDVVLVCHKDSVSKIKKLVEGMSGTENEHLI